MQRFIIEVLRFSSRPTAFEVGVGLPCRYWVAAGRVLECYCLGSFMREAFGWRDWHNGLTEETRRHLWECWSDYTRTACFCQGLPGPAATCFVMGLLGLAGQWSCTVTVRAASR